MRFQKYLKTSDYISISLKESSGIPHIEALPPETFINAIENISKFIITEKLDGANLIFGFDDKGRFYTSRERKGGIKRYSVNEYSDESMNNGFKAAHAALEQIKELLLKIVGRGNAIEVEILFGRQPNAIVYGSNYIAFLRAVRSDSNNQPNQQIIDQLYTKLENKTVTVEVELITTDDGIELKKVKTPIKWKFARASVIDNKVFSSIDVSKEIRRFRDWLYEEIRLDDNFVLTRNDIITSNLNKIPKKYREQVKHLREQFKTQAKEQFILPVKEIYINNVLRKLKPKLRDIEVSDDEDLGIEGVVFLDPETQFQFKLVDKDLFTTINNFNWLVRSLIKTTSRGRRIDLPLFSDREIDIFNSLMMKIGKLFDHKQLEHSSSIKQFFKRYKGNNLDETLTNVAKTIYHNTDDIKHEILKYIKQGINELDQLYEKYIDNVDKIKIELKNGKTIKYNKEIHKRTLLEFAETRKTLFDYLEKIKNAKDIKAI